MRHRSNPADSDNHHRKNRQHHDQLQMQVTQLQKLIRLQNQVIVGLSSCFAIVIISTWVLIQNLPHPDTDVNNNNNMHRPFWDAMREKTHAVLHKDQRQKKPPMTNCLQYGCPLRPVEISQINNTFPPPPFIASSNHILLTHKSNRKKPAPVNQDRAILIPNFGYDLDDNHPINEAPNSRDNFFLGLFDGHDDNGHDVAQFASTEIPSRIASVLKNVTLSTKGIGDHSNQAISEEKMKQIITHTFVGVDNDVPVTGGGCTAVVMLRIGSTLYMANTGDSTYYIVIYQPPSHFDQEKAIRNEKYISSPRSPDIQLHLQGNITIQHQNSKHKANLADEYARIESLGGRVHIPPKNPMGSRVIVRSVIHNEDVGLAMSRSIGDSEWTAVGVIPDPDVKVLDLKQYWSRNNIISSEAKVFVVVGSDGLFDARRADFVANHLAFGLFESHLSQKNDEKHDAEEENSNRLIDVGKKLVNMASPLREEQYRDDITFVAKVLEL